MIMLLYLLLLMSEKPSDYRRGRGYENGLTSIHDVAASLCCARCKRIKQSTSYFNVLVTGICIVIH